MYFSHFFIFQLWMHSSIYLILVKGVPSFYNTEIMLQSIILTLVTDPGFWPLHWPIINNLYYHCCKCRCPQFITFVWTQDGKRKFTWFWLYAYIAKDSEVTSRGSSTNSMKIPKFIFCLTWLNVAIIWVVVMENPLVTPH